MNEKSLRKKDLIRMFLFLVFFAFTVAINLNCSDSNPAKGPECGSGHNTWDSKAQRCRDDANNQIVPNSCCGQ